nr:TadE family type IV pilus minor pilin [Leucobacter viscericola]
MADERGAVTAEFALVLPAVVIVLGLVIGGILLATHRITLVSLAGEISRAEARGDTDAANAVLARVGSDVTIHRSEDGVLHCVSLRSSPASGLLSRITIAASSCAATS